MTDPTRIYSNPDGHGKQQKLIQGGQDLIQLPVPNFEIRAVVLETRGPRRQLVEAEQDQEKDDEGISNDQMMPNAMERNAPFRPGLYFMDLEGRKIKRDRKSTH